MMQGRARIRYSPTFDTDLDETVYYIAAVLQNPDAAERFLQDVEKLMEVRRVLYGRRNIPLLLFDEKV
jgi:plasmid stabilization system protein ParE